MYSFLHSKGDENPTTGNIKHLYMLEQAFKVLGENLNSYAGGFFWLEVCGFFFGAILSSYIRWLDRFLKI